jgi:putative transposase
MAYELSTSLGGNIHPEAMIHYTHPDYQDIVKETGLVQSMSRRDNCIDNAPMESFFGHFKDDVDHKEALNLTDLKVMIDEYMEHYNTTRKQWNLKKMTPAQYRNHLIAT